MKIKISGLMLKLEKLKLHLQGQKMMISDQLEYEEEMVDYLKNNLITLKYINKDLKEAKISKIKRKMELIRSRSESRKSLNKSEKNQMESLPSKVEAKNSYEYYENVLTTLRKNRMKRKNSPYRRKSFNVCSQQDRRTMNNFLDDNREKNSKNYFTPNRVYDESAKFSKTPNTPLTPPKYNQNPLDYYSKNGIFEPRTQDTYKNKLLSSKKKSTKRKSIDSYNKKYGFESESKNSESKKKMKKPPKKKKIKKEKFKEEKYIKRYQKHQISPELRKPPVLLKAQTTSTSKESSKEKPIFEYSDQVILEQEEEDEESFRVEISDFRYDHRGCDKAVKRLEFGDGVKHEGEFLIASFCGKGGV